MKMICLIKWLHGSRNIKQNSFGIHSHQYCAINCVAGLMSEVTSCVLHGMLKLCSLTCSLCAHVHINKNKISHKTNQYRPILPTMQVANEV